MPKKKFELPIPPGVQARGDYLRVVFSWPQAPEGHPRQQRVKTNLRNDPENYYKAHALLQLVRDKIESGDGLSIEDYVHFFPKSQLAIDIENKKHLPRIKFIDALEEYAGHADHLLDSGRRSPNTITNDVKALLGQPFQPLHNKNLGSITAVDFERRQMAWEGNVKWQSKAESDAVATSTINRRIDAITHFFKWAKRYGYVDSMEVLSGFERRKEPDRRKSVKVFTPDQMRDLYCDLHENESPDAANLFAFLCMSGTRIGEALAVAAEDFEPRSENPNAPLRKHFNRVSISRSCALRKIRYTKDQIEKMSKENVKQTGKARKFVPKYYSKIVWKTPKNKDYREIVVDDFCTELLQEQAEKHADAKKSVRVISTTGSYDEEVTFLFWNTKGSGGSERLHYLGSDAVRKMYDRAKERLGWKTDDVPPLKNTRNTKASIMASNGEPMIKIREQLGHGVNSDMLEKHYARYVESGEEIDIAEIFRDARRNLRIKSS